MTNEEIQQLKQCVGRARVHPIIYASKQLKKLHRRTPVPNTDNKDTNAAMLRPRQKTCSVACRVAKHRTSERERRNRYNALKNRDRYLSFDGRLAGQAPAWFGSFEAFEKEERE